jgi:hypothetical protein
VDVSQPVSCEYFTGSCMLDRFSTNLIAYVSGLHDPKEIYHEKIMFSIKIIFLMYF